MPDRRLNGRFGQSGLGGDGLKADRQRIPAAFCCVAQKVKIYEEGGRPAIMTDQVGHENIDDVIVQIEVLHR